MDGYKMTDAEAARRKGYLDSKAREPGPDILGWLRGLFRKRGGEVVGNPATAQQLDMMWADYQKEAENPVVDPNAFRDWGKQALLWQGVNTSDESEFPVWWDILTKRLAMEGK